MEVISPVEESVATGTENIETPINADEDPAEGPASGVDAKAECEPVHEHLASPEKDDKKTSLAKDIAITKPCSQVDNAETSFMAATEDPKAIDACPQEKELENEEITLVVEMNTDAELAQDSGKGEEGSIDHGRDGTSSVQAPEQIGSADSEMGDSGTTSEAAENIPRQKLVSSTTFNQQTPQDSSAIHETVRRELERTDFQKEVVTEEHISLAVSDEIKSFESKGEEDQSLSLVQTREASRRSLIEETLGDMPSGSMQRSMSVEADSGFRLCRKRAAEEQVKEDGLHMSELSEDVVDGERKKGRMVVGVSVQLTNFVQGLVSDLGEGMIGQTKEQGSGSMALQTEPRATDVTREEGLGTMTAQPELIADRTDLETEGVQKGSSQSLAGRDRVQGRNEYVGAAVLTVAVGDKDVIKELGKSHVGMDSDMAIDRHVGIVVGEGTQGGRQEPLCGKESGAFEKNLDIESAQSYQETESGAGLKAKEEVTEGKKSPLGNNGAAERDEMDVSACHIEVGSSEESSILMKAGQEAQRKEATPYLFGQDTSAVPGSLQFSRSDGGEISRTDVLLERQPNQKVDTETKVRLAEETVERSSGRVSRDLSLAKRKEEEPGSSIGQHWRLGIVMKVKSKTNTPVEDKLEGHKETFAKRLFEEHQEWGFQGAGYDNGVHPSGRRVFEEEKTGLSDEANTGTSEEDKFFGGQLERGCTIENAGQKRKLSDNLVSDSGAMNEPGQSDSVVKKAKKKAVNVWAKTTSRKGPKKNSKNGGPQNPPTEDSVLLTPVYVSPDKVEDGPDQPIALSKYDKAEKIELSENRLSASSTKGYRMVRATRGVQEGTWYYEIVVEQLGPTGHTRLGWSTQKGDVQAPVGFDSNSYGYRDLDGSKTHVAVREPYGDLYVEGDVIGFYIHLPNGAEYAPKPAPLLSYRGRPFLSDVKEEQASRVPGSEICFFRNGVCQGTAFQDIYGGRYFPAASMYTLPKEPSCTVRFNFGPEFRYPPVDLDGRPAPKAMVHAPYHNALSGKEAGPVAYANVSATGLSTQNIEPQMKMF